MPHISQTEIRRLDFTLLLVMRGVLRHGRTTRVAEELGLSQSAISYALGRLRALFGDELFVRRPHGLAPTRRALELAPMIERLISEAEQALGLARSFDPATTTRDFRIASLDYLAGLLGPPLLVAFERQAPAARFALRVQRGADALDALRRDAVDLAVGQFLRPLGDLVVTTILTDDYALAARAGHPALAGGRVGGAAFEQLRHVVISVDGDFRSPIDEAMRDAGLARRAAATAPSFPAAFAMVAASDAVAVAPRRLAGAYAARYRLAMADLPAPLPPIHLLAVRRSGQDLGAAWLAERVAEALAGEEAGPATG